MCQPITHYLVAKKGLENVTQLNGLDSQVALGSFGPDLFYLLSGYGEFADAIHANGSFQAFCKMLDIAKATFAFNEASAQKQLAFALGFYAHVITDCVYHPYVYRRSLDHWAQKDTAFEMMHKQVEAAIDQIIQEEIIGTQLVPPDPNVCVGINGLLDQDIAYMFHQALTVAYPDSIAMKIEPYATEEENHPIHQAFTNYCRMPGKLYGAHNVLYKMETFVEGLWPEKVEQSFIDEEKAHHYERKVWPPKDVPSPFSYSFIDMFNMAVNGVAVMAATAQSFIQDTNDASAEAYLQGQNVVYLDQPWNLDTGLPSSENRVPELMQDGHGRFEYGIPILESMYNQLNG
ncbi:zinc dependent phospholipase C family protein [Anaeroarcus burkinensis]|uniref:zinc dependent phospholipase C family protein n=1 Tax=Anaeroarcus burkinensis TaxID=82376 RepID=UPI00040DAD10|nr:zinc dependent phospholipase C family protein [Anaeroarcus burkinensis]